MIYPEFDKSVGRNEIVAVRPFSRMDHLPFHVVLSGDLVELFLHESEVPFDQFLAPTETGVVA